MNEVARIGAEMRRDVGRLRAQHQMGARNIALIAGCTGFTISSLGAGLTGPAIACGVLTVGAMGWVITTDRPTLVTITREDFRSTDRPSWAVWAPFIPYVLGLLVGLSGFEGIALPQAAMALFGGLYYTISLAFPLIVMGSSNFRVGQRRARAITASGSLEGVTRTRLDTAEAHHEILAALVAVGAVDNAWVRAKHLAALMRVPVEEIQAPLEELAAAGVIDLRRIGLESALPKWNISLNPTGVRVMDNLGRR